MSETDVIAKRSGVQALYTAHASGPDHPSAMRADVEADLADTDLEKRRRRDGRSWFNGRRG
eukprot:1999111-Prymnesium_polylepis.1